VEGPSALALICLAHHAPLVPQYVGVTTQFKIIAISAWFVSNTNRRHYHQQSTIDNRQSTISMSRLPPLPPGLPPRPHYPRPSSREGESYRPRDDYYSQDESRTSYAPRPPPQQYQFRGSNGYDSRPDYGRRSPSRRRSPQGRRSPPRHNYPTGDSYRPRDDGFTFRHDAPPGVDFGRGDAYRPRSPPPNSFRSREDQTYSSRLRDVPKHHDGSRSRGARAGRAGYRGRGGPRRAADRDFLQTNRAPTPERMIGMDEEKGNGSRYRALDEMSISDDDDATDDSTGPRKKKSRSDNKAADGDSVPRWSNPDPYTALPPPDETQRKKKDVVKLIRKARVTDGADGSTKAGAATDDFISFDLDDEEGVMKPDVSHDLVPMFGVPVNAPAGPRAPAQQKRQADMPQSSHQGSLPDTKSNPVKIDIRHRLPNKPARTAVVDLTSDPALGNRKRTHRDEIKLEAPRALNNSFGGKKPAVHGGVTPMWKVKIGSNSTPWIELDHSNSANMGLW
jgi:non-canonical poly(A) RNA polymerase PAPD5/7